MLQFLWLHGAVNFSLPGMISEFSLGRETTKNASQNVSYFLFILSLNDSIFSWSKNWKFWTKFEVLDDDSEPEKILFGLLFSKLSEFFLNSNIGLLSFFRVLLILTLLFKKMPSWLLRVVYFQFYSRCVLESLLKSGRKFSWK